MVLEHDVFATQMRKGVLEPCVLTLLDTRPYYGTELAERLMNDNLIASEGTLYPLLARLRRQGLVETSWQSSQIGPPRRYYVLTRVGEKRVESFASAWSSFSKRVDAILKEKKK